MIDIKKLEEARDAYYNSDTTVMSDEEYDAQLEELKSIDPNHSFLKGVGAPAKRNSVWPKEKHLMPMGSLLKINTQEELVSWVSKYTKNELTWSDKLDGSSMELIYENGKLTKAITRGNGIEGDVVTQNVIKMKNVPKEIPHTSTVSIRAEVVLHIKDWKKHFGEDKNPRNSATGCVRRLDGTGSEHVSVYAFNICEQDSKHSLNSRYAQLLQLRHLGFTTPAFGKLASHEKIQNVFDMYESHIRDSLPYEIDGLVIEDDNIEFQNELGEVDSRPRAARAYKFKPKDGETVLKDIIWQAGRTGRITPVAIVEPVNVAGVTIQRITLNNPSEMYNLGIYLGCKLSIFRANDVIPKIRGVLNPIPDIGIKYPNFCPVCNSKTDYDGKNLFCRNKECDAKANKKLMHFIRALDIKGVGEKAVEALIDSGKFKDQADLYKLTIDDLAEASGDKNAIKQHSEIHTKGRSVTLPMFIRCLAIPQFSDSKAEDVFEVFPTLNDLRSASYEQLLQIHGIGEAIAKAAYEGIKENSELIDELLKYITIDNNKPEVLSNRLEGQAFCFSGFRDKSMEDKIAQLGGKIASGVSKNTTHLIVKDKTSTSSKTQKAKELGITIMEPADLEKYLAN